MAGLLVGTEVKVEVAGVVGLVGALFPQPIWADNTIKDKAEQNIGTKMIFFTKLPFVEMNSLLFNGSCDLSFSC